MKIVLAPDSFKGSLSAIEVCAAMRRGVEKVFTDAEIVEVPLADGGEGTLDALLVAAQGFRRTARVRGPLDESIEADWGFLPDGTALIELAQASGLSITAPERRDPLRASTFGTGQLVRAALDAGVRRFMVGLGGSATTDGGTGLLAALGARFFDERDCVLRAGGGDLARLARVDLMFFDVRLERCEFIVLCDVNNPLCGVAGAARVFGPQKGATLEQVERLDAGLSRLADVTAEQLGRDLRDQAGAGAAGGAGFGLMAYLDARMQAGIYSVLEAVDFMNKLKGADLVLTGEGALDAQTLSGKTIAGVCGVAGAVGVPVVSLGGRVDLSDEQIAKLGLRGAFAISDGTRELSWCMEHGVELVEAATERMLRSGLIEN